MVICKTPWNPFCMTSPYKGLQVVYGRNPQMHFDVQVAALFPDRGSHRAVALFHDTTKLQYLLKVRQDFVANASHELRTPLTSISGYVETLLSLAPSDPPEFQTVFVHHPEKC